MIQCHYSAFCSNLSNAQRFVPVNGPAFEDSFSKKWVLENLRRLRVTQGLDGVPRRPRLCLFVDGVKNLSTYGCGMSITLRQGISRSRALTCCLVIPSLYKGVLVVLSSWVLVVRKFVLMMKWVCSVMNEVLFQNLNPGLYQIHRVACQCFGHLAIAVVC